MMVHYYVRASLLTAALHAATSRLRRPIDRLRVLPGDCCLASAGWRQIVVTGRSSGGGRNEDGAVLLGGGAWNVEGAEADQPVLSGPGDERAELLGDVISHAAGDLQASIDEIVVLRGGRCCLVRAGSQRATYQAIRPPHDGGWEISRLPAEDPQEPALARLWRGLCRLSRA